VIIRPVILCGGAGTRLWPVSRQLQPKQLLALAGEQSLLQQTAARLTGEQFAPALVVSAEDQRLLVQRQLEESGASIEAIVLEPAGRNTAAAAALAAAWLESMDRDELLLLVPSDHVIGDRQAFLDAIAIAAPHAEQGAIVTFGAKPAEANTQYGYIEAKADQKLPDGVCPIMHFHEKPDRAAAAEYVASGRFFWNCGIFLAKASTLVDELRRFLPDSLDAITRSIAGATRDGLFVRPEATSFSKAENISIDHAVMEKTSRGIVVPVQMDWSDVGSWDAVWGLAQKDAANNVTQGDVIAFDTRDSLLRNESGSLLAAVGLEKMAVIAVPDAILVACLDKASEVKQLAEMLRAREREFATAPARVEHPWGSSETIAQGPGFQVKHIIINPGQALPLPVHERRSEHWIVVRGTAEVTVDETISTLEENEAAFIPAGAKHRLTNNGEVSLELLEVQSGSHFGKDEIVRFDDRSGPT
jgi:mannose-1-phosphate guanylyltransferase/mannose-6-phosphate isomerase